MRYAFVDESGTETPFSNDHFLVLALLSAAQERDVLLPVRLTHKKYGSSLPSGEMKAAASRPDVKKFLLRSIAGMPVEIMTVVVDKRCILRPPADSGDIYRKAVASIARHAVMRWPSIEICLDKRYSTLRLRERLESAIRNEIADLPQQAVIIRQEDSISHQGLQAADYIAWAIFQKYEKGNPGFYRIIETKIVVEELIEQELW
jgi:hypothetical protein